jgi:23S rRNA (adenosine1067-2'-O)-methyltransferase
MNEKAIAPGEQGIAVMQASHATYIPVVQKNHGIVDSLLHPVAILIRQVLTRSGRQALGLILIDDEENILQALDAGVVLYSLFYSGGKRLSTELLGKVPENARIYEIARRTCKKLFESDKVTRVFALAHRPVSLDLGHLLDIQRDIVALEGLTISGNIGAIVRTSLAFGVGGIVLLDAQPVDMYDRRVIRASRGYIFSLPVMTASSDELVRFCRQNDLPILVMAPKAGHPIQAAASLAGRLVIVFGSEKEGSSQAFMDAAALHVQIPTDSKVDSLNVSTAAGIMLYNRLWFNHPQATR